MMIKLSIYLTAMMLLGGVCQADEIDDIIPYIIQVESSGNPSAVSKSGAVGLMQITSVVLREYNATVTHMTKAYREGYNDWANSQWIPTHYEDYDMDDMYNPMRNKLVGKWYLRRLKDHYLRNIEIVVWYYNSLQEFGVDINPVSGGVSISYSLKNFNNIQNSDDYKLALILSAWNGGITRLRNNGYDINKMPKETRDYVRKVMKLYKW